MFAMCTMKKKNSSQISDINGQTANQTKKHTKNAIHVRWNVRIGIVEKFKSCRRVARSVMHRSMKQEHPMQAGCQRSNQAVSGRSPRCVRRRGANEQRIDVELVQGGAAACFGSDENY